MDWPVHSGGNIQTAINSAAIGDTVTIDAGATFTPQILTLPFKSGCTGSSFVTIRSSNLASLPSGRVGPTDATNMPKIVRTGADIGGLFNIASGTGGGCYQLVGLELTTDSSNQMASALVNFGDTTASHLVVDRCFIHSAEFGTSRSAPYNSTVGVAGVLADGTDVTVSNSYIAGWYGLPMGAVTGATMTQSSAILTDVGPCRPCLFTNNFLQGGYSHIQMGGASQNSVVGGTINASPTPTTTTATLSSVTGITVGMPIALQIPWLGPCQGGDPAWSSSTTYNQWDHVCFSGDRFISMQGGNLNHTPDTTGSNTTFWFSAQCKRDNTHTCYANGVVTNIAGSALTFTALQGESPQAVLELTGPPSSGGNAIWTGTQMGGLTITRNWMVFPYNFMFWLRFTSGNGNHDKGYMENKNGDTIDVEANVFGDYASAPAVALDGGGWPSTFGFGNEQNQNGDSPFVTNSNLTIKNNWIRGFTVCSYVGPSVSGSYEGFLETPSTNILITNNLCENPDTLGIDSAPAVAFQFSMAKVMTVTHNTVLTGYNTVPGNAMIYDPDPPSMFVGAFTPTTTFKDNLVGWGLHEFQCVGGSGTPGSVGFINSCWGSGYTETHNIFVQCNTTLYCNGSAPDNPVADGGFANSSFVTNSGSSPWSSILFTNPSGHNWELTSSSPGFQAASDGKDVGVDWNQLITATAGVATGTAFINAVLQGTSKFTGKLIFS